MRRGIIAGGNWIIDHVKVIAGWPAQDTLVSIVREFSSNGGSPYNILIDLAKLGAPFPLAGIGLLGNDADAQTILADCRSHRIDPSGLAVVADAATSYTDVMTDEQTGRRTFFHQRGANAQLDEEHFNFAETRAKHFHLGYLLLLDRLDLVEDGLPRAAKVLRRAQAAGLLTSLDCVSEDSGRFQSIVIPVLPYVDILFSNDFEAEKLTGLSVRNGSVVDPSAVRHAALRLLDAGVRSWVILHFPEGVYARNSSGHEEWQPSLAIPTAEIAGAAGAGDALAAGVLLGLHEDWPIGKCLGLGVAAAGASLLHATCSGGVLPIADCLALAGRVGARSSGLPLFPPQTTRVTP
jgi:sugar/nucleoside kinase (ribokinase family)